MAAEIEHISRFSDTDRWGEGGHYPWWHSYGWQTQIGALGNSRPTPLCITHGLVTVLPFSISLREASSWQLLYQFVSLLALPLCHTDTNGPPLFVISCRFFVSTMQLELDECGQWLYKPGGMIFFWDVVKLGLSQLRNRKTSIWKKQRGAKLRLQHEIWEGNVEEISSCLILRRHLNLKEFATINWLQMTLCLRMSGLKYLAL